MGTPPRYLILDACVLIDFVEADASILTVASTTLAAIAVARPVFDEVDQLDEDEVADLGIELVDIDLEIAAEAARGDGPLSFQDRLCVLVAAREGWTCVSNDKALRRACAEKDVAVMWGLELLLRLVAAGGLGRREAEAAARQIQANNPRYVTTKILREFLVRLGGDR